MVNWGSNCINPRPRTNMKNTLKSGAEIEVLQGKNWTKLKVWNQSGVELREIKKSKD